MTKFSASTIGLALAGCFVTAAPALAATEKVIYAFQGGSDGANPSANVIELDGTLYGTTYDGGAKNCGTVFAVTPAGVETVLHSFQCGSDGSTPLAGLIHVGGKLYGTTFQGGSANCSDGCGTVFSVTKAGVEKVVYAFQGGSDGEAPSAALTEMGGKLYGTTFNGGAHIFGTVFSVTLAGEEKVLHSFGAGNDGASPGSRLIAVGGTLYGTTENGGGSGCQDSGCGTVFSVTRAGKEKVLHAFQAGTDGAFPQAGLTNVGGTLYGTTGSGGTRTCFNGCGTVFSLTPAGTEQVIYSFQGGNDAANPVARLKDIGGTLTGTTADGGGAGCDGFGCGTIFSVTTAGAEQVLYAFTGGADGEVPTASLNDVVYGTTSQGGGSANCVNGCGTVFAITP